MAQVSMRLTWHIVKAGTAVGVSLWIAVVACVMGCTLPAITGSQASVATNHGRTGLLPDMEGCQHSSGRRPAPGKDKKPVPNSAASCFPVEITLTQKLNPEATRAAVSNDFVQPANFALMDSGFSAMLETAPPIAHTGRDTLLETHLLRI
jgi:hypothetical protein